VGQKNFLRFDNFAMVNGKKVYDVSKVTEFCIEKKNLHVTAFKYSLLSLHKTTTRQIVLNLTECIDFIQFLTQIYSKKYSNDHLHTEIQHQHTLPW